MQVGGATHHHFLIDSNIIVIVLKPYMGWCPSIYLTSYTFDCQVLVKQFITTNFRSGRIEMFQIRPINEQMLLLLRL